MAMSQVMEANMRHPAFLSTLAKVWLNTRALSARGFPSKILCVCCSEARGFPGDHASLEKQVWWNDPKLVIRNGRYGYRWITGWKINRKRIHHIWKSEGLGLPQRRPRRRRVGAVGEIVSKVEYLRLT